MIKLILLGFSIIMFTSCVNNSNSTNIEIWKNEILKTENEFMNMVKSDGLHKAFVHFAADDAVLLRNDKLIIGKNAIDSLYMTQNTTDLSWSPDFVDVSESGDLGYTYGGYVFSYTNESGEEMESRGFFHSVWKKQTDGSWRFVWD